LSAELFVYWESHLVGHLEQDENRFLIFRYDPDWLANPLRLPISLSLPLQKEPFLNNKAAPFFSNLLPETGVRALIAQRLGVSVGNDFKLLEALGGDCAGALSLLLPGQSPDQDGFYEPLSPESLRKMIEQMPQRPLLSPGEGLRLSLAGVQNKLPVYMKDDKFFLPHGARASSHILKPPIDKVDHSVENEVFCMRLAAHLGLPTAKAQFWPDPMPLFLTERYDRTDEGGHLARLHQEDFCQALGFGSNRKYESEGGPTLKMCFALVDQYAASPALDKQRLLQWLVFNNIIGNNDAHGKNISLLLSRDGVKLAPFYDLLSTAIYPGISQKLAMKVGGENRPDWVMLRHWEELATDGNVGPRAVFAVIEELLEKWPAAFHKTRNDLVSGPGKYSIVDKIKTHSDKMIAHLKTVLTEKS
jgi:serine/threonine-protein kinase HipA